MDKGLHASLKLQIMLMEEHKPIIIIVQFSPYILKHRLKVNIIRALIDASNVKW